MRKRKGGVDFCRQRGEKNMRGTGGLETEIRYEKNLFSIKIKIMKKIQDPETSLRTFLMPLTNDDRYMQTNPLN